jgi:hypothetical protein
MNFGVGKTSIFELPPGLAAGTRTPGTEEEQRQFCDRSREMEKGGLTHGPFRPEGESLNGGAVTPPARGRAIYVWGGERWDSRRHWTLGDFP